MFISIDEIIRKSKKSSILNKDDFKAEGKFSLQMSPFDSPFKEENQGLEGFPLKNFDRSNLRFISCQQFMKDIKKLANRIPPNVDTIIGTARSGLTAASFVSLLLHLPLMAYRQSKKDLIDVGNGYRLAGNSKGVVDVPAGKFPIVIDDTVMTGNSMKAARKILNEKFPNAIYASVYCNPSITHKPDFWIEDLHHPHFLEWNLFNSMFSKNIATDLDGVLCQDCRPDQDDDSINYIDFIKNVKSRYPMRKDKIPLIITARIEKYREETEFWLKKYNIRFDKLIMHPAKTLKERNQDNIVDYKAKHLLNWSKDIELSAWCFPLFVESNDKLAKAISDKTKIITICTDSYKCYGHKE